jgi:hypothetical protein
LPCALAFGAVLGGATSSANSKRWLNYIWTPLAFQPLTRSTPSIGILRRATPLAARTAFRMAGAMQMIGVSPAPADGRSFRSISTVSSCWCIAETWHAVLGKARVQKTPVFEVDRLRRALRPIPERSLLPPDSSSAPG